MRNLVIETQKTSTFSDGDFLPTEQYQCCYNCDSDRYYFLEGEEHILFGFDAVTNKKIVSQTIEFKNDKAKPIAMEYCSVNREYYIACDTGNVLCLSHMDENQLKFEEIADFTNGLQCMKISPDHEVVVLLTKDNIVITLSSNFDILNESKISSSAFGEKQFITVGWGKKETQFHGSEGKVAAMTRVKISEKTDTDNGLPKITWRGDGAMFAVSYIDENVNARRFKVYNREGFLQYTSELVNGLEGNLSWRPSGNVIAATRKLPDKHIVALFEKNGLLHREFVLPFKTKNILILDLVWSRDSDVLGVWYKDIDSGNTHVDLWSSKNYHWYLKQTITYLAKNPILFVTWSPEVNRDLMILSSKNTTVYTFYWTVSHSYGNLATDKAAVAVIDGDKVLVTNFRDGIVPPPMAQQTLQFKEPINAISFAPNNTGDSNISSNDFLALMSNNKMVLYKNVNKSLELQYALSKTYNIDLKVKDSTKYSRHLIQHLFWYKPDIILCSLTLGVKSSLCELRLIHIEALDEILIDARIVQEMPGSIRRIIPSSDSNIAYIVVENNKLYTYNDRDGVTKSDVMIVDEPLAARGVVQVEVVRFGEKETCVALTRTHVLYVDGRQVANNVTSFYTHSKFLLVTTLQHALICFKLNGVGLSQLCTKDLTVQPWKNQPNEVRKTQELNIRRVERGSTLVVAVPKDERVVLQMPRGNLECIQPRALALAIISKLIKSLDYKSAFDLMRKQRIDLNLLYDQDPKAFLDNAQKFVDDINNVNWLSLFLSDLKEDDVTSTTYASFYGGRSRDDYVVGKVEKVCETLRVIMEKKDSNVFIQPILISLAKNQKISGLEAALLKLKELKQLEYHGKSILPTEEALKYLLHMVDVNVLYDVALGMYDFELVMFVAQRSQKDPKEYIAFLNSLREMDEEYRKYTIDVYLKRYMSALDHISRIPERFEECLTFIQSHDLYAKALAVFGNTGTECKSIAVKYGKYLVKKREYREAGIMFVKGEDYEEAIFAFKLALSWQDAIVAAVKLNLSSTQLTELCEDLVKRLVHDKRYEEAALILSKHLNRFEDAVTMLCKGRHWHQAWTEAYCMKREDLIETYVTPGLQEHTNYMLFQIGEHMQDFEKYKNRLIAVRHQLIARKHALRHNFQDDEGECGNELSDLFSDTTSIAGSTTTRSSQASHSTGRSYRSSKNRRKHERKLQSMKEGGAYEDLALIRTLHQLVTQAYKQKDEVKSVAEMLLYTNKDQLAQELYLLMNEFLEDIRKGIREIWPSSPEIKSPDSEEEPNISTNPPPQSHIPENLIEPHLLQPPVETRSNWILNRFSDS